ncbi:i-spanin [Xylella phage Paz]|uniref:I-spanin n=1 Tax=Xylella phage Paz TaxID=1415145 RepID=V5Q8M6_9CAUD|nr:i-spanin [Xylella phage Paz]AHB12146.1 i-spanin [Xylella phage Paz]
MSTVRDYIIILLITLIVGLGAATFMLNKRLDAALEQKENATSLVKGYEEYTSSLNKFTKKREEVHAEAEQDRVVHQEWADQPVPDDLADKLREH